MGRKELVNKPLVEAIFEIKWKLQEKQGLQEGQGTKVDPHYKLLPGRLSERLSERYPYHEQLQTASMPDEIVPHHVQHRFRKSPEGWPLVQVGPGILTVNETETYKWEIYKPSCLAALGELRKAYPSDDGLTFESILLRYIDAIVFDHTKNDVFDFLREMMGVELQLPNDLFVKGIDKHPQRLVWQSSFASQNPPGTIALTLSTGKRGSDLALLMDTVYHSLNADVPDSEDEIDQWLESAHEMVVDHWFFTLIEGDLERKFSNE